MKRVWSDEFGKRYVLYRETPVFDDRSNGSDYDSITNGPSRNERLRSYKDPQEVLKLAFKDYHYLPLMLKRLHAN